MFLSMRRCTRGRESLRTLACSDLSGIECIWRTEVRQPRCSISLSKEEKDASKAESCASHDSTLCQSSLCIPDSIQCNFWTEARRRPGFGCRKLFQCLLTSKYMCACQRQWWKASAAAADEHNVFDHVSELCCSLHSVYGFLLWKGWSLARGDSASLRKYFKVCFSAKTVSGFHLDLRHNSMLFPFCSLCSLLIFFTVASARVGTTFLEGLDFELQCRWPYLQTSSSIMRSGLYCWCGWMRKRSETGGTSKLRFMALLKARPSLTTT